MAWDAVRFLRDYRIPHFLEGKNVRPGCVSVRCPVCTDHSNHGNFNPATGGYFCWRCGGHSTTRIISRLIGVPFAEADRVFHEYDQLSASRDTLNKRKRGGAGAIELPGEDLGPNHRAYLAGRGFDPDFLVSTYGIRGTGPACRWQGSDFRLRVIIPIHDEHGRLVNFQGRDITNRQELRYKGPPVELVVKHHKELVYGAHLVTGRRVVVVEGVFDAWRMGPGFVATFGTSLTPAQVATLANWDEIFFMFDPEPEAQARAREYGGQLAALGRKIEIIRADYGGRDPGDLTAKEAEEIRKDLL